MSISPPRARCFAPSLLLALAAFAGAAHAVPERLSQTPAEALARLKANAGGSVVLNASTRTAYTSLRAPGAQTLWADGGAGSPVDRAQLFLSLYGAALGISDPASQLVLQRISRDVAGRTHVHLDQVHDGLPVYGARVVVHMNDAGITGVNGVFVRNLRPVSLAAARDVATLRRNAMLVASKHHAGRTLKADSGRWVLYPEGLLRGQLGATRLAYAAAVDGGNDLRDEVLVDARTGAVLDRFSKVHHVRNREIYTPDQSGPPVLDEQPGPLTAPPGPADPALIADPGHYTATNQPPASNDAPGDPTANLWVFAGGTWALYKNMFDRDGYDDCVNDPSGGDCQPRVAAPAYTPLRGDDFVGQIQRSVYLINQNCPNAYWNGSSTNYCPGFDADDVVSHEWSHGYTQFTHGLIYAYQSGALNESYSDIFGEAYDLLNNLEGPLGAATLEEHKYYEEGGSRWVVGEDLSEEAAALLLRDMWQPDDFPASNPGKVTSENYSCGASDNGGVHYNSSVPNHAFAMLVDGTYGQDADDKYNGQQFTGIGMVKAAHIYFQAMNNYQTPTTDFPQHAIALRQSCEDLKGVTLKNQNGANHPQTITQADCDKLNQALLATEMDLSTPCPYIPVIDPTPPAAVCEGANNLLVETWEDGDAGWTKTSSGEFPGWDPDSPLHNFTLKSDGLPDSRTGTVAFADNIPIGEPGGGNCPGGSGYNPQTDDMSGQYSYDSPAFTVPAGVTDLTVRFDHYVNTEVISAGGVDGGHFEVSINGEAFELVDESAYLYNAPNGALLGPADTSTNPRGGEIAWSGKDVNPPSGAPPSRWGTTVVDLSGIASPGDTVQLRWTFSQDGCNGTDGWYIDNIRAYSCPILDPPVLTVGSDYENPDTNGSFTLNWVRPTGATGPDLLQKSASACAPMLSDDAASLAAWVQTRSDPVISPQWQTSTTKANHEGNSTFWANPTSEQETQNSEASLAYGQPIVLPAGVNTLTFGSWYFNESDDQGIVEISTDNGTTWVPVYSTTRAGATEDGALANSTEDLAPVSIDLTAHSGDTIRLRFRFVLGQSNFFFNTQYGWYIDDIRIVNETWGDVLTTPNSTVTLSNQLDGAFCYRVRTTYPITGGTAPSRFSNIVAVTVDANLVNTAPVANAGLDFNVKEDTQATLDGSASVDINGDVLTYAWVQVPGIGPTVTLADADKAQASFIAPTVDADTVLRFELTVTDPQGEDSTDIVDVTVNDARAKGNNTRLGGALGPGVLAMLALALWGRRRRRNA